MWNIAYDGLLKELQTIPSLNAVASTDDLAIIIATQKQEEIGNRLYVAMRTVTPWCSETGLKLATDKTEVILLTGKRIPKVRT